METAPPPDDRQDADRERLAAITQSSPVALFELNADGAVLSCNAAADRLAANLGRHAAADLLPPDITDIVATALATGNGRDSYEATFEARTLLWSFHVKQHGGWISVVSEVEKGSTFNVFLPTGTGAVTPAVPRPSSSSKTIRAYGAWPRPSCKASAIVFWAPAPEGRPWRSGTTSRRPSIYCSPTLPHSKRPANR